MGSAGILIGTSKLSVNEHVEEQHESTPRVNYFLGIIRMEAQHVERIGGYRSRRHIRDAKGAQKAHVKVEVQEWESRPVCCTMLVRSGGDFLDVNRLLRRIELAGQQDM